MVLSNQVDRRGAPPKPPPIELRQFRFLRSHLSFVTMGWNVPWSPYFMSNTLLGTLIVRPSLPECFPIILLTRSTRLSEHALIRRSFEAVTSCRGYFMWTKDLNMIICCLFKSFHQSWVPCAGPIRFTCAIIDKNASVDLFSLCKHSRVTMSIPVGPSAHKNLSDFPAHSPGLSELLFSRPDNHSD